MIKPNKVVFVLKSNHDQNTVAPSNRFNHHVCSLFGGCVANRVRVKIPGLCHVFMVIWLWTIPPVHRSVNSQIHPCIHILCTRFVLVRYSRRSGNHPSVHLAQAGNIWTGWQPIAGHLLYVCSRGTNGINGVLYLGFTQCMPSFSRLGSVNICQIL